MVKYTNYYAAISCTPQCWVLAFGPNQKLTNREQMDLVFNSES